MVMPPSWRPFPVASLAAVLLVLAAYSNSVHNAFHFDDSHAATRQGDIRRA